MPLAGAAGRRSCWACLRSAGPPHDLAGPGGRLTRMLIAGAVCPHPPLLIPAALGAAASDPPAELRKVTEAAAQAVARLLAAGPDLIAVVGGGPADREYGPAAAGGLHDYGVHVTVGTGDPVLPLSLTVGRWLLERAEVMPAAKALDAAEVVD